MLERMGFAVQEAADGRAAVQAFSGSAAHYRLVLLDLTMPHMDGKAAFHAMRRIRPDVPVILMSGHSEETATRFFLAERLAGFVQKPFLFEHLRAAVCQALHE